jgi:hypothetical protein
MTRHWCRLLTILAGVLGALVFYGIAMLGMVDGGLVSDEGASLRATKMISANIGALAAAAAVAAWPSDRGAPLSESLATWAVATVMLMAVAAPVKPVSTPAMAGQDTGAIARSVASR